VTTVTSLSVGPEIGVFASVTSIGLCPSSPKHVAGVDGLSDVAKGRGYMIDTGDNRADIVAEVSKTEPSEGSGPWGGVKRDGSIYEGTATGL
jgi:hypothetical protein